MTVPYSERNRLEALYEYQILDMEPQEAFDDITRLAAYICGTPIAFINFVISNRQWIKSQIGLEKTEILSNIGLSCLCIEQHKTVIIPDTLADERSRENLLVTASPYIRFYASVPLITPEGQAIGTLCVMDRVSRQINSEQVQALEALSRQVISQVEMRRNVVELTRTTTERQRAKKVMQKAFAENLLLAEAIASVSDGVLLTDPNQPDNPLIYANPAFFRITGYQPEEVIGRNCRFLQGSDTDPKTVVELYHAIAEQREFHTTILNYRKDGQPFWNELKISPVFSNTGSLIYFVGIQTDITEQKKAEEALRKSEAQFRRLAESNLIGIIFADLNGNITEANDAFLQMVGYKRDDLYSGNLCWHAITPPEYRFLDEQAIAQLRQSGVCPPFEKEYVRQDGSRVSVLLGITLVEDSPNHCMGFVLDLSHLKQIEGQQRESEQRFQLLARTSNDAIWDRNLVTKELWWNEGVEKLFHYSATEVESNLNWWYEHIHPEDRERVVLSIDAVINSGVQFWSDEYRFSRADGTYAYIFDRGYVLYDDQGAPVRMLGAMMDISDRKQAEQKIREQAALLDITTDAILVQDLNNRILLWNQGAKRLYGWHVEEVLGQKVDELLYKEASLQLKNVISTVVETGEWQGELHQIGKSNQPIIVSSRWTLMRDEAEQPKSILVVNTDITEKKQLEAQFLRAQRLESIGTLASGIAHDLNNILTPILAGVQLLQIKFSNADEQTQRLLKILEPNAKRGAALVKQVLSFARGVEGQRTILQTKHLLNEIRQIMKETFPKSIEAEVDIAQDLWLISGDATQLHQIFMNLCVNARDAMPDGGTLSITAENIRIDENYVQMHLDAKVGAYIVITISDTGTGIPPEILERIFEPFFTTKDLNKGTGLGLSTVIGIIKSHGGFVNVSSKVGEGTQFKVYLPAAETPETQIVEDEAPLSGKGELILVVDDEAPIREVTKTSLETYNYRVITASDGIDAIVLYAQHKDEIGLVLLDMMMPLMDGITTTRTLQKMNPNVKIIAVSGLVTNDKLAAATGVNQFLPKPYTAQELLKTINGVLHSESDIKDS